MRHNGCLHFAVDTEKVEEVEALIKKVAEATSRQPGVVFAYGTHCPAVLPEKGGRQPMEGLEELFDK